MATEKKFKELANRYVKMVNILQEYWEHQEIQERQLWEHQKMKEKERWKDKGNAGLILIIDEDAVGGENE